MHDMFFIMMNYDLTHGWRCLLHMQVMIQVKRLKLVRSKLLRPKNALMVWCNWHLCSQSALGPAWEEALLVMHVCIMDHGLPILAAKQIFSFCDKFCFLWMKKKTLNPHQQQIKAHECYNINKLITLKKFNRAPNWDIVSFNCKHSL